MNYEYWKKNYEHCNVFYNAISSYASLSLSIGKRNYMYLVKKILKGLLNRL